MARDTDKKITLSNEQSWMSPIPTLAYVLNGLHVSSIFKFLIYVQRKSGTATKWTCVKSLQKTQN